MICNNCRQEISDGAGFCPNCGTKVEQPVCFATAQPVRNAKNDSKARQQFISDSQQQTQENSFNPALISHTMPSQSSVVRKKVNLKVLVSVLSVLIIGVIMLTVVLGVTKDSRVVKKAWESKDVNQVVRLCNLENRDLMDIICDYISKATDKLNNDFTYEVSKDSEPDESVFEYLKNQWGTIFLSYDGEESALYDIDYFDSVMKDFNNMINSKINYFEALTEMLNADESDDYLSAASDLLKVLPEDNNYSQISGKVNEAITAYMDNVNRLADEYVAKGDYNSAVKILEDAVTQLDFDGAKSYSSDIATRVNETKITYASQYAKKAEEFLKAGEVEAAVGNIKAAIKLAPNAGYDAKLSEYRLYLPLVMYTSENVLKSDGSTVYFKESDVANDNSEQRNIMKFYDGSILTYNFGGKYDKVIGTIYVSQEAKSDTNLKHFEIYGDGKLLYTSPTVTAGFLPKTFEVSVSGVQTLEIHSFEQDSYWGSSALVISDLVAQKTVLT